MVRRTKLDRRARSRKLSQTTRFRPSDTFQSDRTGPSFAFSSPTFRTPGTPSNTYATGEPTRDLAWSSRTDLTAAIAAALSSISPALKLRLLRHSPLPRGDALGSSSGNESNAPARGDLSRLSHSPQRISPASARLSTSCVITGRPRGSFAASRSRPRVRRGWDAHAIGKLLLVDRHAWVSGFLARRRPGVVVRLGASWRRGATAGASAPARSCDAAGWSSAAPAGRSRRSRSRPEARRAPTPTSSPRGPVSTGGSPLGSSDVFVTVL